MARAHLYGIGAVKKELAAHGTIGLHGLLAAVVDLEQRQAHACVAAHAVEEVDAQAPATPVDM